jgi:hypothetical protein
MVTETPWNTVLKKLVVSQILKNFCAFYAHNNWTPTFVVFLFTQPVLCILSVVGMKDGEKNKDFVRSSSLTGKQWDTFRTLHHWLEYVDLYNV